MILECALRDGEGTPDYVHSMFRGSDNDHGSAWVSAELVQPGQSHGAEAGFSGPDGAVSARWRGRGRNSTARANPK